VVTSTFRLPTVDDPATFIRQMSSGQLLSHFRNGSGFEKRELRLWALSARSDFAV